MSKFTAIMFTCLLSFLLVSTTWAQEVENIYADLPQWRTDDGAFVLGDPNARMRFIEFSDFLCRYCQSYEPVVAQFIEEYVISGQAQFEYRLFPVVDPVLSPLSAALAECADTVSAGTFWLAHDLLFEIASAGRFTEASSRELAERLNLDHAALSECATGASQYQTDLNRGYEMGVQGTPTLFAQYDDAEPVTIANAVPEHFAALVDAARPKDREPVEIEEGRYKGISAFRRTDGGFVLGSPEAPLTIVAFEDFLCPHCQTYVEVVHSFIDSHVRTGKAQFEYRFYPLVDPQLSVHSTQIAECVGHLDMRKFWDAHDLLFEMAKERSIGAESSEYIAQSLDLDIEALSGCMDRSIQFLIDTRLGQKQGVTGTPAVRARRAGGELDVIFAGQQALDRGAAPIDMLTALADGSPTVTVGPPERTVLDSSMLPDISLLTGEPCGPPCWENIRPGQTDMQVALDIVNGLESITVWQASDADITFGYESGTVCCQIVSDDEGIVAAIVLQLSPRTLVGEVLGVLGEPQYVTGMPFSEKEYLLVLVYPENSAFLYALVDGADGALSALSPVVSAIYGSEEQMKQVLGTTPLDDWKGYLTYSEYMDGEYDNNP